ncbi:MAG: hypothetical protein ABF649_17615 [Bacillus sp. (in: firmicutes)]
MTHEEVKILLSQLDEKLQSLDEKISDSVPMTLYKNGFASGLNYAKDIVIRMEQEKNNTEDSE